MGNWLTQIHLENNCKLAHVACAYKINFNAVTANFECQFIKKHAENIANNLNRDFTCGRKCCIPLTRLLIVCTENHRRYSFVPQLKQNARVDAGKALQAHKQVNTENSSKLTAGQRNNNKKIGYH